MKLTKIFPAVLIAVFACLPTQSNAQISVGANVGFFKILEDGVDAQFGFNVTGKYALTDNIKVGANVGFYSKSYDSWGYTYKSTVTPITALIEYGISIDKIRPYAGVDVGMYRFGIRMSGESDGESYFGFAPGVGCNYELTDKLWINANMKLHVIMTEGDTQTAFGLLAGIVYNL